MNIVILCNGDFPTAPQPLQALAEADHIVCCDGAYNALMAHRPDTAVPLTVIGDLDSIGERPDVECIRISEQLSNDETKAFRHVIATFPEPDISILGATGRREDHTIGNISHLADFREEATSVKVRMLTDYGVLTPIDRPTEFRSFPRQQVSLFSMTHGCLITTQGLEYPLHDETLPLLWQGTLNASLGDRFEVSPKGGVVLVYQTYNPKN